MWFSSCIKAALIALPATRSKRGFARPWLLEKNLAYYLELNWSYTVEQESYRGKKFYIIRVNELPGVVTDAETVEEGMEEIRDALRAAIKLYLKNGEPIPEPIEKKKFKGNIAYQTSNECHYLLAMIAGQEHKSISKTLDLLVDAGITHLQLSDHRPRSQAPSRSRTKTKQQVK